MKRDLALLLGAGRGRRRRGAACGRPASWAARLGRLPGLLSQTLFLSPGLSLPVGVDVQRLVAAV